MVAGGDGRNRDISIPALQEKLEQDGVWLG
jgi:hypothetical protein